MSLIETDGYACSVEQLVPSIYFLGAGMLMERNYVKNERKTYVAPHCMGRTLRSGLHWTVCFRMLRQCSIFSRVSKFERVVFMKNIGVKLTSMLLNQHGFQACLVGIVVVEKHEMVQALDAVKRVVYG
jgi:hypothetical protein